MKAVLLCDLGNSRLKWQLLGPDGGLLEQGAMASAARSGAALAGGLEEACGAALARLHDQGVACAMGLVSVASTDQTNALLQWGERATGSPVCRVWSEPKLVRLTNGYRDPKQLGADRWAAALGAAQWAETRLPSAMTVLVVSAGTATVIDSLTRFSQMPGDNAGPNWHFDGGVILPGVGLMRSMLGAGTSALALLFDAPAQGLSALGWPQDSSQALAHGIGLAQTAPIVALPPADAMVVHGGHAQDWIEHFVECIQRVGLHSPQRPFATAQHCPDLVFDGIFRAMRQVG